MNKQIKKREIPKIEYFIYCPECKKEIKGTNPRQVEYNLGLHLDKHKKEKK